MREYSITGEDHVFGQGLMAQIREVNNNVQYSPMSVEDLSKALKEMTGKSNYQGFDIWGDVITMDTHVGIAWKKLAIDKRTGEHIIDEELKEKIMNFKLSKDER